MVESQNKPDSAGKKPRDFTRLTRELGIIRV